MAEPRVAEKEMRRVEREPEEPFAGTWTLRFVVEVPASFRPGPAEVCERAVRHLFSGMRLVESVHDIHPDLRVRVETERQVAPGQSARRVEAF